MCIKHDNYELKIEMFMMKKNMVKPRLNIFSYNKNINNKKTKVGYKNEFLG